MVEFTLLEVHLDDATVDANASATADAVTALPFSSVTADERDEPEDSETEAAEGSEEDDERSISLAPLFVILGLVGLAVALKKLLSDDE